MYWYSGLIFLFFFGCASHNLNTPSKNNITNKEIMKAVLLEKNSFNTYYKLYKQTNNKFFLKRAIILAYKNKNYDFIINHYLDEQDLLPYYIDSYFFKKDYKKAFELASKIKDKEEKLLVFGNLYFNLKKFDKSKKYFLKALKDYKNEFALDRLLFIYKDDLKKEKLLKFYLGNKCIEKYCDKLAAIYYKNKDYRNLLDIYIKIYKKTKNPILIDDIYKLAIATKSYDKGIEFFSKDYLDEEKLLQFYLLKDDKVKSYKIAYNLYKQTKDLNYLGIYAINKFETSKQTYRDKLNLINRLKKVVKKVKNPIYYNYLGYSLILFNKPKEGLIYVKKALKIEPKNEAYLDSLAMGYYYLHKCTKAYKIIKNISLKDKEIIKHKNMIKKCLKGKK